MAATLILGTIAIGLAMFALSIGVVFKKRTPLKGECHGPVDGGGSCSSCGGGSADACKPAGEDISQKKSDLLEGNFELQTAPEHVSLLK